MLNAVIKELRSHCPSFGGRVSGAAEFAQVAENANMTCPAAYVMPLADHADDANTSTGYRQKIRDSFSVVVALSAAPDRRGQAAANLVHDLRAELFRAILGHEPHGEHGPITYDGGKLLDMNRATLWWQFEFSAETEITEGETRQGADIAALPVLETVSVRLDAIDPADSSRFPHGGPDGRAEGGANITFSHGSE